jgi:hypothetical protein
LSIFEIIIFFSRKQDFVLVFFELFSFVLFHSLDELDGLVFVEVGFIQRKHRLFKSNLVFLVAVNDLLCLGEDNGIINLWEHFHIHMDGLTETHASSVQHAEQEQVAVFFSGVFRVHVGNGVSFDLDWDGESEFRHGLDFLYRHLDIFIDVVGQAGELDASFIRPVSVVLQGDFGEDSFRSSCFNNVITIFDDFASVDFLSLSSLTEHSMATIRRNMLHPLLPMMLLTLKIVWWWWWLLWIWKVIFPLLFELFPSL